MGVPRNAFRHSLARLYDWLDANIEDVTEVTTTAGAASTAEVSAAESGDAAMHRTVLTLTDLPVSVVSVTTGNGVGGTKVYDFPEGHLYNIGVTADLAISVASANQADFTDATPEGQLGIGTVAPANADALGTDATDDDFATATDFTMAAYADAEVLLPPEAPASFDGSSTAIDMYVNVLVDAADIDDDTTTEVLINGTIVMTWANLGDT